MIYSKTIPILGLHDKTNNSSRNAYRAGFFTEWTIRNGKVETASECLLPAIGIVNTQSPACNLITIQVTGSTQS